MKKSIISIDTESDKLQTVEAKVLELLEDAKNSQLLAQTTQQGRNYDAAISYLQYVLKTIDEVKTAGTRSLFDDI